MNTLSCIAAFLMAVLLFAVGEATECQYRHFEMQGCIADGNVDFNRLVDPTYTQEMCSAMQPVLETCIGVNRRECPNISVFQGAQGRAIDRLTRAHRRLCSGRGGNNAPRRPGPCSDDHTLFSQKLDACHDPLQVNLRENQMCGPMQEVYTCMNKLARRNGSCRWLTNSIKRQVRLGAEFYRAIRAVKYRCA